MQYVERTFAASFIEYARFEDLPCQYHPLSDIEKNLSIQRIPTYLWVNDAHIVSKMEGNVDFYSLKKWIEKMRE